MPFQGQGFQNTQDIQMWEDLSSREKKKKKKRKSAYLKVKVNRCKILLEAWSRIMCKKVMFLYQGKMLCTQSQLA